MLLLNISNLMVLQAWWLGKVILGTCCWVEAQETSGSLIGEDMKYSENNLEKRGQLLILVKCLATLFNLVIDR